MLLFAGDSGYKVVIASERIYDITARNNTVYINYESGDIVYLDDGSYQKQIATVILHYETSDEVDKIMRQFYKAANSGFYAFYFGGSIRR